MTRLFRQTRNRRTATAELPDSILLVEDNNPSYGGTPVGGGVLRLTRPPGEVSNFNPAAFRQDYQVAASYLDPLLWPNESTLQPEPWLAESWTVSDDGTEIRYTLRTDVLWHDGARFTAADVVFSFEVYRTDIDSAVRNFFSAFDRAEAIDERTVRIQLLSNDPTWLFNASTLPVFQRAQYEAFWNEQTPGSATLSGFDWEAQSVIGTGPWMLQDANDLSATFAANKNYWQAPPWFDSQVITWEASAAKRLDAWNNGDADAYWPLRGSELTALADRAGRLFVSPGAGVMFAAFNFANPNSPIAGVFDDNRVRQALSLLIDRDRYAESVFAGFCDARGATTVAQPWAHDATIASPNQDIDQALALLADAGWADYNGDGYLERAADGFPLSLVLMVQDAARPELLQVLARVKLDLEFGGVDLQLALVGAEEFERRWATTRDYDLIAYAYDTYPGFTDFDLYGSRWDIRRNALGWNPGGYANPAADDAIDRYLAASEISAQIPALQELQEAVTEDLFGLWLGFPRSTMLVDVGILGYVPNIFWPGANARTLWRSNPE